MSDNGGSAFPSHGTMGEVAHEGMTLRDYFAAKAMAALIAASADDRSRRMLQQKDDPALLMAVGAYAAADAMLKAREQ